MEYEYLPASQIVMEMLIFGQGISNFTFPSGCDIGLGGFRFHHPKNLTIR